MDSCALVCSIRRRLLDNVGVIDVTFGSEVLLAMISRPRAGVLMIALDAAEPALIERWMDEGHLPNLDRLRRQGSYGRLGSTADALAGSVWPTFHTGTLPGDHALYHFVQWKAGAMAYRRPTPEWLPQAVFWRQASEQGRRVVAIDLSLLHPPEPIDGIEVSGWCAHDLLCPPASFPPETLAWARREFGGRAIPDEVATPQRAGALLRLHEQLLDWTARTRDLASVLMARESWDLFLVSFTATHLGGHKLWDASATRGRTSPREAEALSGALRELYMAVDAAVGRLVEEAGPASVLVFSLHGMGANTSRVSVLPEMMGRILPGPRGASLRPGRLERVRQIIPTEWRSRVKSRLPRGLQDRLTSFWRTSNVDFSSVRAFPMVADLQGYIRINVRGREAQGTVEPGREYDQLCEEIAEGLGSFADAETGRAVVDRVVRADRLYPEGRRCAELPDLIVRWSDFPACEHRQIESPRFGTVAWPTPGRHVDGRAGNHRGGGFLIASGPGLRSGASLDGAHIVDLAPTAFSLLDLPPRPEWIGRALPIAAEM